jgi:hypothetical protein
MNKIEKLFNGILHKIMILFSILGITLKTNVEQERSPEKLICIFPIHSAGQITVIMYESLNFKSSTTGIVIYSREIMSTL